MAIQMTRAEYEAKYGSAPSVTSTAPIKMTRAEYEAKYNAKPKQNYFQRVGTGFAESGQDVISSIKSGAENLQSTAESGNIVSGVGGLLRSGLRSAGAVARSAFTPVVEFPGIKQAIGLAGKGIEKLSETKPIREIGEIVSPLTEYVIKNPELGKDAQSIIDIVTLGTGKVAQAPLKAEVKAIGQDIVQGAKVALTPTEEAVQNKVISLFNKSIKPTAKKTLVQGQKYENDVINALKTIKSNADNLNIEDVTGELVTGRTPQTLNELGQALEQTKKVVFDQYDNLSKQAGELGAKIDANKIANEVDIVASNKALQLTNPEILKYAQDWSKRLRDFGAIDTQTTQEVIKYMNNNLNSFYRNPTYDMASKASIDAGIANNFRNAIDDAIQNATGQEYQVLKNQYGALKAIENDVTRALMRDAKKNVKGLLDYTDIFTGGQMLSGILSLSPQMFAKGALERGIKEYIGFLNNPNRAVKNIFDKLNIDTNVNFVPQSEIGKTIQTIKSLPKGEAGFINLSGFSGMSGVSKDALKRIHPDDIKAMQAYIDYARIGKEAPVALLQQAETLVPKFKINPDLSMSAIANEFEKIFTGRRKFVGTNLPGTKKQ